MPLRNINWFKYSAPQPFYSLAGKLIPWFAAGALFLGLAGLYVGLLVAPTDAQQGDAYRIIFVHVPAAWMSMFIYLLVAFWAAIGLIFNARLASMLALSLAPTGALMTFIALFTGALWGKPTWGAWWVWDARLTSVLILFFLYLGYMILLDSFDDKSKGERIAAIISIVGFINVPIIKFSVEYWNSLHQPASIMRSGGVAIDSAMLKPLLLMFGVYFSYFVFLSLLRVRSEIFLKKYDLRRHR